MVIELSEKKHIAIYVNSLKKNGTERVVSNLLEFLVGRGHRITLVTTYRKESEFPLNPAVNRIMSEINTDEITSSRIRNFCRRFMKLRRIWQSEKPDVILSFIGLNNIMTVITSRFLKNRVVVAVRGTPYIEYPDKLTKFAARHLFRFADTVLLQTEAGRGFFPPAVRRKAVVVKNLANPCFFRPRFTGEREKTIVAATRIHESKNHRMLILAFAKIAEKFPEYELYIYGEGELRESLTEEVKHLGLSDRIHLPGHAQRLEETLWRAGIYVMCSNTEGVPNTLIEAMLLGLCCISTDFPYGGAAALITHGENGLLTPTYDVDKMAGHLEYLIENPDVAEKLGQAAHRLQATYDPQTVGEDWERLIMGDHPKRRGEQQ